MKTIFIQTLLSYLSQSNNFFINPDLVSPYILIATPLLMFFISCIAFSCQKPNLYYLNNMIGFAWVIFVISKLMMKIIEILTIVFDS